MKGKGPALQREKQVFFNYASSLLFKNLEIKKLPTMMEVTTTETKSPRNMKNEVYDGSPELNKSPNIIIVQFKLII